MDTAPVSSEIRFERKRGGAMLALVSSTVFAIYVCTGKWMSELSPDLRFTLSSDNWT